MNQAIWIGLIPFGIAMLGGLVWLIIEVTKLRTLMEARYEPMHDWWLKHFGPHLPK